MDPWQYAAGTVGLIFGLLFSIAVVAGLTRVVSESWYAGQAAVYRRDRPARRPQMDDTLVMAAHPRLQPDPAPYVAPGPAGGVCVVGHWVPPNGRACRMGHAISRTRTEATTPQEIWRSHQHDIADHKAAQA